MKKIFYLAFFSLLSTTMMAQQFSWQGVLRDGDNIPMGNQSVSVQLTIMKDGSAVMRETHDITTSDLGLMNLQVCSGTSVSGNCSDIDWSDGAFMLNVAVDPNGGSNYNNYGSSPIAMVPRSVYAQNAGTAQNVVNDQVDDADADPTNELQELQFDNNSRELSISGVQGVIRIPSTGGDADPDPTNEIQTLDKNNQGQIILTRNGGLVTDGVVDDEVDDADADPTNEIQDLELNGTDLSISGGNSVSLAGLGGGGGSVWTEDNGFIYYDLASNPDARIEYGPGKFDVIFSANQYRNIASRSNRMTDEMAFTTPNSGDKHAIGHYIQDFPSPDRSQFYMSVAGDTMAHISVLNFPSPGPYSVFQLYNEVQNTRVLGFDIRAAGGLGQFTQAVGNQAGVRMGALSGGRAFAGIADPNNPNTIIAFMTQENGQGQLGATGTKNFYMDHPNDASKQIWYACIEGPEAAAYERGTAQLINGEAFIPFSEHFELVINAQTMTVNLTPNSAESLGLAVVEKTEKGIRVKELYKGTGNYSFDWEAKAVRKGYEDYKAIRPKAEMQTMEVIDFD